MSIGAVTAASNRRLLMANIANRVFSSVAALTISSVMLTFVLF